MHIAIWLIAALCLGLWSLLAWGVAALLGADPGWVGDLRPLVDQVPFGQVLDVWVPGWEAMARAMIDITQATLGWLGTHAGWVVWLLWGAGALLIAGTAAVLSLIVLLVAKVGAPQRVPPVGPGAPPGAQA
jgi:hypothetical protein